MTGKTFDEMNSWRMDIKHCLEFNDGVQVINPCDYYNFENPTHKSEREIMDFDLMHVISSDLIIVNVEGLNGSVGSIIEIYEARFNHKIPIIAFGSRTTYENLHPWIKECISRYEESMDAAVDYVCNYYLN